MVFALVITKDKAGNPKQPKLRQIKFKAATAAGAREAVDTILNALYPDRYDGRKMLFVLNPFGGTKQSRQRYHTIVVPFLRMAGLFSDHQLIETQSSMHASTIAHELDVSQYRSATTISGDGVFHEFINGLFTRPDWETASRLPVGIIGSGSANAMSKCLDIAHPELAMFAAIKCHTKKIDIFSYTQNNIRMFSHLLVMWAFLADVDIESERFRFLGSSRFIMAAIVRLLRFRNYKGRLYMLPADRAEQYRLDRIGATPTAARDPSNVQHGPPSRYTAVGSDSYKNWPLQFDTYFQFFLATNAPWVSTDFLAAPHGHLDDGKISVIWSEKMTSWDTLQIVLDSEHGAHMALPFIRHAQVSAFVLEPESWVYNVPSAGSSSTSTPATASTSVPSTPAQHMSPSSSSSEVAVDADEPASAPSLHAQTSQSPLVLKRTFSRRDSVGSTAPAKRSTKRAGIMDVSGEEVEYAPITVEVFPSMLNVIIPSWLDDGRWESAFQREFGHKMQPEVVVHV
ncbi:ATP-NAD kinase-like domain-containing protein [Entophlyctis helioformis]|nr:ATP-NAD kinase-like domain-containing protein [Entophlyctis helioformis]